MTITAYTAVTARDPHHAPPDHGARIRELECELADLRGDLAAALDRLLYAEAAIHHILNLLGISPHGLPDPLSGTRKEFAA